MDRRIRLTAWSRDCVRLGTIGAPLEVRFTPRWNAASSLTVTVDPRDRRADDLRTDGCRLVAEYVRDGAVVVARSGVVERVAGKGDELEVTVRDDWADIMQQVTGWPNPVGTVAQQGDDGAYWHMQGPAETVALAAIAANATRLGVPLTVPASLGRGATIDVSLRMHPLADRLYPAVDQAGIGVHVVQQGSQRHVVVQVPQVRTVPLTQRSGAVLAGEWSLSAATVTRVVLGAGGEGTARTFRTYIDGVRESSLGGVREAFIDARDLNPADVDFEAKASARAAERLAEGAPRSSVNAPLNETARYAFGHSYNLGDRVPIQLDDSPVITDVVREVEIAWTVTDGLVVTPKVGGWDDSPDAAQARLVARMAREQRDRRTI